MTTRHLQATQLRGVNRDARTVDIVASDFSLDSYGTRIDPNGWDLDQFKRNGPICVQHDSYSKDGLPVAQSIAESVRVDNGELRMTAQFPPKGADECADRVFELVAAGILRGISVGFDPIESEDVEEQIDGYKKTVRIYRKQRLMEVSFVTIPSNDNGLVVRSRAQGHDEQTILTSTLKLEESLRAKGPQTIDDVLSLIGDSPAKDLILKHRSYFEQKQPANRASTKVLGKFFKRILNEEVPEDEAKAWDRMGEAVEAMHESEPENATNITTEVPAIETTTTPATETTVVMTTTEVMEETPTPKSPDTPVEAPQDARKASVQIPISLLLGFPEKLRQSYVEAAVEALRRGIPVKEAQKLIDGMNTAVTSVPQL